MIQEEGEAGKLSLNDRYGGEDTEQKVLDVLESLDMEQVGQSEGSEGDEGKIRSLFESLGFEFTNRNILTQGPSAELIYAGKNSSGNWIQVRVTDSRVSTKPEAIRFARRSPNGKFLTVVIAENQSGL